MRRDNYDFIEKEKMKTTFKGIRFSQLDLEKIESQKEVIGIKEFSELVRTLTNIGIERILEMKEQGKSMEEIKVKLLLEKLGIEK